jgi:hypothetical protein
MTRLSAVAELLTRACLALVPVVLARRARYGGIARPAEFLAAACSLPLLQRAADLVLFTLRVGFDPRDNWFGSRTLPNAESLRRDEQWYQWQDQMVWPWTMGLLAVACISAPALALTWRLWPGWVRTVLLLLAWLGFCRAAWMIPANLWPFDLAERTTPVHRVLYHAAFYATGMLPYKLAFDVPAAAAWLRLWSPGAPRATWLERLALGLVFLLFLRTFAPPPAAAAGASWPGMSAPRRAASRSGVWSPGVGFPDGAGAAPRLWEPGHEIPRNPSRTHWSPGVRRSLPRSSPNSLVLAPPARYPSR